MKELICSLIPSAFTLLGVIITCTLSAKATRDNVSHRLEISQAVTEIKLEELTREVRKHNGFAEKIPVINEQLKVFDRRLSELEEQNGKASI